MDNSTKIEADSLPQINIYAQKHQGLLVFSPEFLEFIYLNNHYKIDISYSNCFYGGKRPWFICPLCLKKAGVLYILNNTTGCRTCFNLTYHSRNENHSLRNDPAFRHLNTLVKIHDLTDQLKRCNYAGQPTKKAKKLAKLYSSIFYAIRTDLKEISF